MGQQYTDASGSSIGWIVIVVIIIGVGGYVFSNSKSSKQRPVQKGGVLDWKHCGLSMLIMGMIGLCLGAFLI
jgi:hypothetical protein